MNILFYDKVHEDYNQRRYYEKQDGYGQHSGEITDGYFRAEDLKQEGKQEWAGYIPVFKDRIDAEIYADTAIMN